MNAKLPAPSYTDTRLIDENGGKALATRTTGPSNTFLVPTSMPDAMKLAEYMAASTLVPRDFQKKPADCLMVVMQAVRWQMDPFAVIQKCSVIQSKLMYEGQLVAAVVNTRGNLKQRLSFTYFGEGKDRGVTVSGQFYGEDEPREVDVFLAKAKTTAKVWETQPDQQLGYHGCRVWARRHMPELMLGVYSGEEFDDVKADAERDIANGVSVHHPDDYADGTPERLTNPPAKPPPLVERPRQKTAQEHWQEKYVKWKDEMDACTTVAELEAWRQANRIYVNSSPEKWALSAYYEDIKRNLREAELSDQVVHDSDSEDPRPASMADFYDDEPDGSPDEPMPRPPHYKGNERASSDVSPPATSREAGEPHQSAPARVPLSQRAISAREKDGIPEYLDRRK